MSRSGYSEDLDQRELVMYRGQVASAIRGKRGQSFLRELRDALDAMPRKRLIRDQLIEGREVCALGCLGAARGIEELSELDPEEHDELAKAFNVAHQLIAEIEFENDEGALWNANETPEDRWARMRGWVEKHIRSDEEAAK